MKKKRRQELTRRRLRGGTEGQKERENARIERARECELERESERDEETTTTTTQSGGKSSRRRKCGNFKETIQPGVRPRCSHGCLSSTITSHNLSLESHGRLPGLAASSKTEPELGLISGNWNWNWVSNGSGSGTRIEPGPGSRTGTGNFSR
jgi:hypothetical protein